MTAGDKPLYYRIDGAKAKAARRAVMLTQAELAEVSGVSYNSIQRIEQGGKRTPLGQRASTVKVLAKALGIDPVDILWTSSPQGQSPGQSQGRAGEEAGEITGEKERQTPASHALADTKAFDLALDVEPRTINAEGKDLGSFGAANGNGKSKHIADVINVPLAAAMWERHPDWKTGRGALTFAGLQDLTNRHGAKAVNYALDELYANQDGVDRPHPYLVSVASSSPSSRNEVARPSPPNHRGAR